MTILFLALCACGNKNSSEGTHAAESNLLATGRSGTQGTAVSSDPNTWVAQAPFYDPQAGAAYADAVDGVNDGNEASYTLAIMDPNVTCGLPGTIAPPQGGTVYVVTLESFWSNGNSNTVVPAGTYQLGSNVDPKDGNITTFADAQRIVVDDNCTSVWSPINQLSLVVNSTTHGTISLTTDDNVAVQQTYTATSLPDVAYATTDVWPSHLRAANGNVPAATQGNVVVQPLSANALVSAQRLEESPIGAAEELVLTFRDPALNCNTKDAGGSGAMAASGTPHGGAQVVVRVDSQGGVAATLGNHVASQGSYTLYDDACHAQSVALTGGTVSIQAAQLDPASHAIAQISGNVRLLFGGQTFRGQMPATRVLSRSY